MNFKGYLNETKNDTEYLELLFEGAGALSVLPKQVLSELKKRTTTFTRFYGENSKVYSEVIKSEDKLNIKINKILKTTEDLAIWDDIYVYFEGKLSTGETEALGLYSRTTTGRTWTPIFEGKYMSDNLGSFSTYESVESQIKKYDGIITAHIIGPDKERIIKNQERIIARTKADKMLDMSGTSDKYKFKAKNVKEVIFGKVYTKTDKIKAEIKDLLSRATEMSDKIDPTKDYSAVKIKEVLSKVRKKAELLQTLSYRINGFTSNGKEYYTVNDIQGILKIINTGKEF